MRSGHRASLYSNISLFSASIHIFAMKTTSHGRPGLKNIFLPYLEADPRNEFFRQGLSWEMVFRPKS